MNHVHHWFHCSNIRKVSVSIFSNTHLQSLLLEKYSYLSSFIKNNDFIHKGACLSPNIIQAKKVLELLFNSFVYLWIEIKFGVLHFNFTLETSKQELVIQS